MMFSRKQPHTIYDAVCRNGRTYFISAIHSPAYHAGGKFCTEASSNCSVGCYPSIGNLTRHFIYQFEKGFFALSGRLYFPKLFFGIFFQRHTIPVLRFRFVSVIAGISNPVLESALRSEEHTSEL